MKIKFSYIILIALLSLAWGCTDKEKEGAAQLMEEIRSDYEAGNDSACLIAIDTLRSRYPKAVAERKEALEYFQKASLRMVQKDLELTDKRLEQEKARFAEMEAEVNAHKAALNATADELTALTMQRMKRDSLQTRYDVLCQEIRFIHKRQKEN